MITSTRDPVLAEVEIGGDDREVLGQTCQAWSVLTGSHGNPSASIRSGKSSGAAGPAYGIPDGSKTAACDGDLGLVVGRDNHRPRRAKSS